MKPIKLKDLLNEMEMPNFPTEKSDQANYSVNYVDDLIKQLTPEQQNDNAELFGILQKYFAEVKKHGANFQSAVRDAQEAFEWNDLDWSLVDEYLENEAGAANNPNDSDQV